MDISRATFEQPVNEHIRVCLRIEHLLRKAQYFINETGKWESRCCLNAIVNIINLLDRPDLRNKISQEVARHLDTLKRLQQTPRVNHERLSAVIHELEIASTILHYNNGKFGGNLRDNAFLKSIRQYLNNPGGGCGFNTPGFELWLQQLPEQRIENLKVWLRQLDDIHSTLKLMLRLVRESCHPTMKLAEKGFMQMSIDPHSPCQLIRVSVSNDQQVFPQISVGRHGLSVRFLDADIEQQASQTERDIEFELTLCIL